MKRFTRDFLTGATAIVGVLGTAGMLMVFGEIDLFAPERYSFDLQLDTARGLGPGSPVTLDGVAVGRVRTTSIAEGPGAGVLVRVEIDGDRRIPREFQAFLDRSLAGDATLDLGTVRPGPGVPVVFVTPGEIIERKAITLVDEIGQRLAAPIDLVTRAAATFEELTAAFVKVSDGVERVLAPRTPEEVDAGAPATLASTIARLDRVLSHADAWLDNPAMREDAARAVGEASDLIASMRETLDAWRAAAKTLEAEAVRAGASIEGTSQKLVQASERLAGALAAIEGAADEVQKIAGEIRTGEGTAGMLLRDPDLYRSLLDASRRLDRALEEAELLLETYRKDGLPIRF